MAAGQDLNRALELYAWNARVSSALMLPAHFAEVATRNAVSDALLSVYGPRWPWDHAFEFSLPNPPRDSPRANLVSTRARETTTGKVIAELKFSFWQRMFTARHDPRVWGPQILTQFPHTTETQPAVLRGRIYNDLEAIRRLRNRVAHHEPVFTRPLAQDLAKMLDLIQMRSQPTADWVRALEDVTNVLSERP
jgi:hypothetical protein